MPLTTSPALNASTILRTTPTAAPTCLWCHRIAALCNGERTLQDIGTALHLPLPIVQKLARKALEQGWLVTQDVAENQAVWLYLEHQLSLVLGGESQQVLHRAASMARQAPGFIPPESLTNFLIAIELLVSEPQRPQIAHLLDELRHKYAA